MLKQFFEPILSKLGELIVACAQHKLTCAKDFKDTLEILQKKLKLLNAKAFDVKAHIKNAELSGQKKRKREVEEWLIEVKLIETKVLELVESSGFIDRFTSGGKATRLIEEVENLVDQSRNFGEVVADVRGIMDGMLPATRMVGGAFEENLANICSSVETVSRIGVYGMGGAGKTTLAKHVNNRLREQPQTSVFWVVVSQEFTITSLQDKIARFLGVDFFGEDDEGLRAGKLHRRLSEMKNSVLILDDVWENIDLLRVGCPISKECCRLIITTRSLDVCHKIGCEKIIEVQNLDKDEAWKLFNETFTVGKEIKLDPLVEEIMKSVAKLCGGLPLGIITMAASMRGEKEIYKWRDTFVQLEESIAGQNGMGEGDEVFKVLKYSFDQLNKHDESECNEELNMFQLCFLYCSLFPEDYEIPRKELVSKLISEGLLERRKSRREQVDQGHVIVDKLVKVCLLESSVDKKFVKMHDLVRGMALQIGGGKYMVRAGDYSLNEIPKDEEWTEDLEKVSLMYNGIRSIPEGTSPNCPKLSTLLLSHNRDLEFIPDSFFTKMQGLCTLDLSRTWIKMLPNSVSELKSLKALLLENCEMLESVPYLGNLKALRELNLDGTAIKEVPEGVKELFNLKFLSVNARKLEILPEGLLVKLVRLQYVKFPFHVQLPLQGIENLKQVERFWGRLENVRDFNRYAGSRQIPMHDAFYNILVGKELYEYSNEFLRACDRGLILSNCNLKDEKLLGQDIQCLSIDNCEGLINFLLDHFSPSNYPGPLKKLRIERCGGIEYVFTSEQELPSQFFSLKVIELEWLEDLKGLIHRRPELGASPAPAQSIFSSLTSLKIHECNKMRKLGLPVLGFPNLKEVEIERCGEIEEIFQDEGRISFNLPKLKVLSVWGLPRLKRVCKATITCNSIQQIFIVKCPILMKKLPLHLELDVPPPPTLRVIGVEREWWKTLEWENPNLPHLLQPCVKFISYSY